MTVHYEAQGRYVADRRQVGPWESVHHNVTYSTREEAIAAIQKLWDDYGHLPNTTGGPVDYEYRVAKITIETEAWEPT